MTDAGHGGRRDDRAERLLEAVARELLRVGQRLERIEQAVLAQDRADWITARELASRTGFGVDYIYRHASEFGVRRYGDGPRPRLRFPPSAADGLFDPSRSDSTGSAD
jgi:hypothetical protein